jgi:hypothetical protein
MKAILFPFLLLYPFLLIAQEEAPWRPDNNLAIGIGFIGEKLPEGVTYYPQNILARFYVYHFSKKAGGLSLYGEPQFVPALLSGSDEVEFEYGLNAGFAYHGRISDQLYWQAAIGSGPHYITLETELQSSGFIFSDNFELGLVLDPPNSPAQFMLRTRFRHISNAGLKNPNKGIDNWFLILGMSADL